MCVCVCVCVPPGCRSGMILRRDVRMIRVLFAHTCHYVSCHSACQQMSACVCTGVKQQLCLSAKGNGWKSSLSNRK